MKLRILSDLHLEFTHYQPQYLPAVGEDVVILAGDIGIGTKGVEWAKKVITDRPVIYVMGNHEYYGHDYQTLLSLCKQLAAGSNVQVLEKEEVFIKGQRFLCATLWTDFALFGEEHMVEAARWSSRSLNDYRLIKNGDRALTTKDTFEECEKTKAWLQKSLEQGPPAIVVTHHATTPATMNPFFGRQVSNASFHNDLDKDLSQNVLLFVHGHTHYSCKKEVGSVPVVTNQRGYPREGVEFDWDYVVEIPEPALHHKPGHVVGTNNKTSRP